MEKKDFQRSKKCNCRYCKDSEKIRNLVKKYKMNEQEEDFLLDINFQILDINFQISVIETRLKNWNVGKK